MGVPLVEVAELSGLFQISLVMDVGRGLLIDSLTMMAVIETRNLKVSYILCSPFMTTYHTSQDGLMMPIGTTLGRNRDIGDAIRF